MRTTIELPDELFMAVKLEALIQGTTIKDLITRTLQERIDPGMNSATENRPKACFYNSKLSENERAQLREEALTRMREGIRLGGKPLKRDEIYHRHSVR